MRRFLVALPMSIILAASAWALGVTPAEGADDSVDVAEEAPAEADEPAESEELDDPTLDEQGYSDEGADDFRPSEEIQSDQSITFPTDI